MSEAGSSTKRLLKPIPISIFSDCYGAGKSTVAAILTKHFSNVVILSFAAPLKNMAAVFFADLGFAPEMIGYLLSPEGKTAEITNHTTGNVFTPRRVLQTIGTEWGRNCIAENVWADIAKDKALQVMGHGLCPVFDDMRFNNEYAMLKSLEARFVHILRPGTETPATAHASEGGLRSKHWDFEIINNSTLDMLEKSVLEAIERNGLIEEPLC